MQSSEDLGSAEWNEFSLIYLDRMSQEGLSLSPRAGSACQATERTTLPVASLSLSLKDFQQIGTSLIENSLFTFGSGISPKELINKIKRRLERRKEDIRKERKAQRCKTSHIQRKGNNRMQALCY